MNDFRGEFVSALRANEKDFGVALSETDLNNLAAYYKLVEKHNPILHLVAPCSPETFAVRHVLESLFLQKFLPENAKFADIGTGAGLPSIPCLIFREDLRGILIESKLKKADFLDAVLRERELEKRAEVFNRQFEEVVKPDDIRFVTCRALEKFTQKLPKILKWSKKSKLLLFGGNILGAELAKHGVEFERKLIPQSEQRFLFIARN
ncbi:MAG: class I SAM-dependent methyltransferase [Acidobacteria bacterium]|nr:class I SAM-dependent methyltransferase [Acidobacteriota bacterium]